MGAVVVLQFCSRHRVEWWSYRVEFEWSCVAVLMSQSNRQVYLFSLLVVTNLGVVPSFKYNRQLSCLVGFRKWVIDVVLTR